MSKHFWIRTPAGHIYCSYCRLIYAWPWIGLEGPCYANDAGGEQK